jgi:hypothetical protein
MSPLLASANALGSVPAVFAPLVACVALLVLRSVGGVVALPLTRRVSRSLDLAIAAMGVLFLIFVAIRFIAVG